jgi:hypothetical protein
VLEDDFDPDDGSIDTNTSGILPNLPISGVPGDSVFATDPALKAVQQGSFPGDDNQDGYYLYFSPNDSDDTQVK